MGRSPSRSMPSEGTPLLRTFDTKSAYSSERRRFRFRRRLCVASLLTGALISLALLERILSGPLAMPESYIGDEWVERLIPFPFEKPFEARCPEHEVKHAPECAMPDPALPPSGKEKALLLDPISHVDPTSKQILDTSGRERYWRGMNVAYKVAPHLPLLDKYHPSLSFSRSDMRLLARLGLNVVRLGVPWSAVQPTRPSRDTSGNVIAGQEGYDEEYLKQVREVVRTCAEEGLHVLISGHQDLYAERFCGNGMPAWSITSDKTTMAFPRPIYGFSAAKYDDPDSFPIDNTCKRSLDGGGIDDWGKLYVSDAVTRAFWGLYTNDQGTRDDFAAAWRKVAATLGEEPNVIGYEILNEPFVAGRTWWSATYNFFFGSQHTVTESEYLQPLYTQVHDAIREVDNRTLIFYEPVTGNAGGDGFKNEGFLQKENAKRTVLSYHVYGWNMVNRRMGNERGQMEKRTEQANKLSSSTMITEFDVEYGKRGRRLPLIAETLKIADENLVSWIGWQYKEFIRVTGSPPTGSLIDPASGFLRQSMARMLSHPYAEAVAGRLISMKYDAHGRVFRMEYVANGASGEAGLSVIRLSEDVWGYADGFDIDVTIEGDDSNSDNIAPRWKTLSNGRIGAVHTPYRT